MILGDASTSIFRIEGWRFFTNFLSLLEASWPRESPRESKMSTFQKNASDLFLAPPRLAGRLLPCDLFHRFSLSPLSLFSLSLPSCFSILVHTPPFVAQFHLAVSRQLSRENCEKGWGRERGNSLRGILVPTRHYLARETSQLRWWCSYTVGIFGGKERKRERKYISCHITYASR